LKEHSDKRETTANLSGALLLAVHMVRAV